MSGRTIYRIELTKAVDCTGGSWRCIDICSCWLSSAVFTIRVLEVPTVCDVVELDLLLNCHVVSLRVVA